MSQPLAFLLTWTTFGTWLPGDDRGSVDKSNRSYGSPVATPNEQRHYVNASRQQTESIVLSQDERDAVDRIIRRHCLHRQWWLGACNVRSNHVHCVVTASETKPEVVVQQLKSWATRTLREVDGDRFAGRVWTREASTRYLWDQESVDAAVRYVVEGQDLASRWGPPGEGRP